MERIVLRASELGYHLEINKSTQKVPKKFQQYVIRRPEKQVVGEMRLCDADIAKFSSYA